MIIMIGMLIVACVLIGYVAWFMYKVSGDADKLIEEKMREHKAEVEEILNRLDK
jgi:flagellar basal body-associated protein FliL